MVARQPLNFQPSTSDMPARADTEEEDNDKAHQLVLNAFMQGTEVTNYQDTHEHAESFIIL